MIVLSVSVAGDGVRGSSFRGVVARTPGLGGLLALLGARFVRRLSVAVDVAVVVVVVV